MPLKIIYIYLKEHVPYRGLLTETKNVEFIHYHIFKNQMIDALTY